MQIREPMPITENDELKLQIIGYRTQGESILITIGNDRDGFNKFAGIIDCFKTSNHFITKKLLDDYQISKLDFICWTHPDWDHTYGLSSLLKYIKNDTVFVLPEGVTACEIRDIIDEKNKNKNRYIKEYTKIFEIIYNKIEADRLISANHSTTLYSFDLIKQSHEYRFTISSFAPFSKIVRKCSRDGIERMYESSLNDCDKEYASFLKRKNNLYSVGLRITLTSVSNEIVSFCLCSDIDNATIEVMSERIIETYLKKNTIFKIPHHCSENSSLLVDKGYVNEFEYGVTTSYKIGKCKLPNEEILAKYKKIASHKKGKIIRTDKNAGAYGIVSFNYKISDLDNYKVSDYNKEKCSVFNELAAGLC